MAYRIIFCRKNKRDENPLVHKVATIFIVARYKGVGSYPNSVTEVRKVSFALVSSFHLRWTTLICITFHALQIYLKVLRTKILSGRRALSSLPPCTPPSCEAWVNPQTLWLANKCCVCPMRQQKSINK